MNRPDPSQLLETAYRFLVSIHPRFSDVDRQQHLNNVAIAQYYEEARSRLSLELFGATVFDNAEALRLVVAATSMTFLQEGSYPEPLTIGVGVRRIGTTSYHLSMALFQSGRCLGVSDSTMVHLGATGPEPLPPAARQRLESLLLTP